MESEHSTRSISYVLLLIFLFAGLFLMDQAGMSYTPNEHRLNQKPHTANPTLNPEDQEPTDHGEVEADTLQEQESEPETVEEPISEASGEEVSDAAFFETLITRYQSETLSQLGSKKARTDVVLRYYRHPPDGTSAYALEKLGFYIHERPVAPEHVRYQSNAVYFGDSVRVEDIQIVSYTLLNEGLPIKVIKPSKFAGSWKARSIEIGTDTTLLQQPTLSLSEIRNLSI